MYVITTTETFSDATRRADLNLQDFVSIQGRSYIWRLPSGGLPETIVSLVRSYNTDGDKYPQIAQELESKGFHVSYDAGPEVLWLEGSIYPEHGQLAIAISLPKPRSIQGEANAMISSALIDGGMPTNLPPRSARSLEQKYHVEIRSLADDGHPPASTPLLRAGDIVVLHAHECIEPKSGGVAMILIRYKITRLR
ncbi:hypothetical protein BHE90_016582 [Fusarium euwallaceae]|uniref:Uncharacterized protein n=2 Tax=Fusarium solani species complex TaxID=232080 RepID=A0A428RT13_9HYPO|nr:hypothetical protein CEP52_017356 [Fusarium oligoseptatum]RTE69041.1 hypothetical protein BHE90_016582 [Fusarium euwallaceae]